MEQCESAVAKFRAVGDWWFTIYALSMLDGTLVWAAPTGGKVQSSPAVAGNLVAIGSDDGYVYGLDRLTGKRLWRVKTGGAITSTPAIVDDMALTVLP